ncbi:WW domain-containing oxidoreductase-like [Cydia fagiglandana]|uniref:WW domain-containing oxidoreductase-like n=1 Tax=Cydia fagiglandana TaxID=1458189 RepID=UPI002FEE1B09
MLVSNCFRGIRLSKHINSRHIRSLAPQAYTVIERSAKTVMNTAERKLFGPTGEEIVRDVELGDKYCLITGANGGLGLEMTRCLNARGAHVLMACRNTYAATFASKKVCKNLDRLSIGEVNLASLRSVKNFTDWLVAEDKKFDVVILNAGVFGIPRTLTEDGLETIFQVNYLSQIYMLMNIEKLLAPNARIVFLTSESHRYVYWPLEKRLMPTEEMFSLPANEYTSIKAFNISKLCCIFAMHYLGYRWMNTGRSVFSATPGSFIKTKLCRNWWVYELLYTTMQPFNKSIPQAAATPLYCATSPELDGMTAVHFKNCKRSAESDLALDSHLSFRLFDMTLRMVDERVRHFESPLLEGKGKPKPEKTEKVSKEPVEDDLISNYSC